SRCRGPAHRPRVAGGVTQARSAVVLALRQLYLAKSAAGLSDGYLYDPNLKTRTANDRRRIAPVMTSISVPVRCSAPTNSISTRPTAVIATKIRYRNGRRVVLK